MRKPNSWTGKASSLAVCATVLALASTPVAFAKVADALYVTPQSTTDFGQANSSFRPNEIVEFGGGSVSVVGSVGAAPLGIDAYARDGDGAVYFSLDRHAEIGGMSVAPADILHDDGSSLSLAFDASRNGLAAGTNIDALALSGGEDLLFSVDTHVQLNNQMFNDSSLIEFDGNQFSSMLDLESAGLAATADVGGLSRVVGTQLAITMKSVGQFGTQSYRPGDIVIVNASGAYIETTLSLDTPIQALASEPAAVGLFSDSFRTP